MGVILALGLWLRVYLAGTPGYFTDLTWFYAWADAAHRGNVGSPYHLPGRLACDYPPGYILILSRVPWLYELFTGRLFHRPPDEKRQMDEVDRALGLLAARRERVMVLELVERYKSRDSERYRQIMEGKLGRLKLISPDEYRRMRESFGADPARYEQFLQQVAARLRSVLAKHLPYAAPDRLRELAVWVKLPALLFDLAGAAVLFVLLRRRMAWNGALVVATVYLFLPAVIYDSACWGQVDAVHSLLMLLCLVVLLAGHSFLVGLLFGVALLTKFQSIVILPVLAAGLIRRWHEELAAPAKGPGGGRSAGPSRVVRSMMMVLVGTVVAAGIVLMPFAAAGSAGKVLATYGQAVTRFHYASVCAFNPWWFLNARPDLPRWYYGFMAQDQVPFLGPITPKHVGLAALAVFSLWVMWLIYRRGCTYGPVAAGAAAMAMGFFVLPTEIHERYGFPAMILSGYLVGAGWRHLPVLLILSVAQLYNFAAVQPVEDPRFDWLMPIVNVFQGHGGITYLLVLIHVGCLVYFTRVLYQMPVRPLSCAGAAETVAGRRGRSSRRSGQGPRRR